MAGPYELQSPKDIAMEYGGNKQKIAQAAQMGMIDPTAAVMAGMFIDKMRSAQQEEMAPQTTVAQDVMAAPQMAAGLGATPQAAMAPQMAPTEAGVAALPVPDDMVPDEYAGGGIVAFDKGGGINYSQFGPMGKRIQEEELYRQMYLGKDQSVADLMGYIQGLEEKAGERAERAKNIRMIQAGLGIAAGDSPFFAKNLAGALPALEGYSSDVAKQEEAEFGRKKVRAELSGKERAEKIGILGEARKAQQADADRASREKIQAMAVNNPSELVVARALQKEGESLGDAVLRLNASKRAGEKTTNSVLNFASKAYEAANNNIEAARKVGGQLARLEQAAAGSETALELLGTNPATKKPWTAKEAEDAARKYKQDIYAEQLKSAESFTGFDLQAALRNLQKENSDLGSSSPAAPKPPALGINPKTNKQYQEGDKAQLDDGTAIIVKNGQWVYDTPSKK